MRITDLAGFVGILQDMYLVFSSGFVRVAVTISIHAIGTRRYLETTMNEESGHG